MKTLSLVLLLAVLVAGQDLPVNGNLVVQGTIRSSGTNAKTDHSAAVATRPFREVTSAPAGACAASDGLQVSRVTRLIYGCDNTSSTWMPFGSTANIDASSVTSGVFSSARIPVSLPGVNAGTATALQADPAACPAGQYVSDVAANGALTCTTPSGGGSFDASADLVLSGANVININRQTIRVANAAVTGTTVARVARQTGSPATAVVVGTSDTEAIGIVVSGAGTTGSADIAIAGRVSCEFDAARTAGNFVQISTTLAGRCKDAGATRPTSGGILLGKVVETAGSASAGDVLMSIEPVGGSGGGSLPSQTGHNRKFLSTDASAAAWQPAVYPIWTPAPMAATTCTGSNQDTTYTIPAGLVAVGDRLTYILQVTGAAGGTTVSVLLGGEVIANRTIGGGEGLHIDGAIIARTTTSGYATQMHVRENGTAGASSATTTTTWASAQSFTIRASCTASETFRLDPILTHIQTVVR